MNVVTLAGRLAKDPEVRNTNSGKTVAQFTLAVDRAFKGPNGEKEADFINIVAWNKTAELVGKYSHKGSFCMVSGRIQVRSYDANDGTKKWVTEVVADRVEFGPKQVTTPTQAATQQQRQQPAQSYQQPKPRAEQGSLMNSWQEVPFDEEIPF